MTKILSFFSKKIVIYLLLVVVVIVAGVFVFGGDSSKKTISVVKADLVQEVAVTGKIKANQTVNLGFDKSGRVRNVYVSIGENVKQGQLIASLESGEILADLDKAKASLKEEEIKLREIKSTSGVSFSDASKNLDTAIRSGFADADNAIRNRADPFFKTTTPSFQFEISITSGNFTHYFSVPNELALEIGDRRGQVETILTNWQKRISNLSQANLSSEANKAISDLNTISLFLDKMAEAVNSFSSADYSYDTTVSGYKTTISSARTEISDAISAIVLAKDKLNSAPVLGEGGQFESVLTQEAKVAQAAATVASLEAVLNKATIVAPFDGVLTLQDAKVGGAVLAGNTLVSIISQDQMYVEANVSEVHIGKIMVGNTVSVTFDAFPSEQFEGVVSYIEPGDIIIDGVVNYKVRVALKSTDPRIKNGLTSNLKIQTAIKRDVLTLPLYAVTKEGDQSFVNKVVGKSIEKIPVQLGLLGNNGSVEVLNGLNQGDIVQF